MNRLAEIHQERAERRQRVAEEAARQVFERARAEGLEITLIGSLATNRFSLHSDVDFFVHGQTDTSRRIKVERIVADAFRVTNIPYDIVYASDLRPERAREFLDG